MSDVPQRRQERESREDAALGPWAQRSRDSRGRLHPEDEDGHRTAFARDRDRIIHSRAFRRLEYKTQVFVHHEGDHLRDRLTHTIEASQIARSLARGLAANEDLAEAVVLAHDLGHTPFGHAGEHALDALMAEDGGFDHNRQTLRIVDWLEERHPAYRGLNLTFETREGILKHGCHWPHPVPVPEKPGAPSLEAQLADLADEIAYVNHDLDDGLRSGLLREAQLDDVTLWREMRAEVDDQFGRDLPFGIRKARTISGLIHRLVTDCLEATASHLDRVAPTNADEVRRHEGSLAGFSEPTEELKAELKRFLYAELYAHPRVREMSDHGAEVLSTLFRTFRANPERVPAGVVARFGEEGEARAIADYIAGMTDRFALAEHEKLLGAR